MIKYLFVGGPETIKKKLQGFIDQTQVDEVMITSHIFNHEARMRSYQIIAEAMKPVKELSL